MSNFKLTNTPTQTFSHTVTFNISEKDDVCLVKHFVYDRYEIMSFLDGKVERMTINEGRKRWKEFLEQGMTRTN